MKMQKVNCQYGAPMGRRSYGLIQNCEARTVRLFRVNLDQGGYDNGGAYWGTGEPIYCATDDADYFETVRASNRDHAALLLNIEPDQLKNSIRAPHWLRWSTARAFIGQVSPVFEVREFGQPIGYLEDWHAVCVFAQTCQYTQGSGLVRGEGLQLYSTGI
jgi:hypothetical protein